MSFTTGEVAKICGVSVRTVQYYDRRGILSPSEMSDGGRRMYCEDDVERMKIICFLRELDISLDNIERIFCEDNSREVVSLIIGEHERMLSAEILQKQKKLELVSELRRFLKKDEDSGVNSIGDVVRIMETKRKMRRMRTIILVTGIPVTAAEWISVLVWIMHGIWWPFVVYCGIAVMYGIWVSMYYFKHVEYIFTN